MVSFVGEESTSVPRRVGPDADEEHRVVSRGLSTGRRRPRCQEICLSLRV